MYEWGELYGTLFIGVVGQWGTNDILQYFASPLYTQLFMLSEKTALGHCFLNPVEGEQNHNQVWNFEIWMTLTQIVGMYSMLKPQRFVDRSCCGADWNSNPCLTVVKRSGILFFKAEWLLSSIHSYGSEWVFSIKKTPHTSKKRRTSIT